jgi:hypothetical protein
MREWRQKNEQDLDGAFKEIGFIRLPADDFASRFEISFTQREHGKRAMLSYAAIELRSGARFFLQHEHQLSERGVWLYGSATQDPSEQIAEFAAAFGIDPSDIAAF